MKKTILSFLILLCLAFDVGATAELLYTFNAEDGTVGQAPPNPPLSAVTGPNIPIITSNPVYSGTKAYDVVLDRSQPNGWNPYRTEMRGKTNIQFQFERSYWIGFSFRRTIWATDTSSENFPLQIHETPSDWTNWGVGTCQQSAASSAPIVMISANNTMVVKNLTTSIWSKPVDLNTWHTVVFNVRWSKGNTGFVRSWYDGIEQARKPASGTTTTHRADSAMDAYCGPNTAIKGDVTFIPPIFAAGIYKWDWKIGRPATLTTLRRGTVDAIKIAQDIAGNDDAGGYAMVNPGGSAPTDTTPPVLSAISESAITSTGVTINWTTNEAANGQIEYGATTAYGSSSTLVSALTTGHNISLTGLSSNALIHYRIRTADAVGNVAFSADRTFTTLPAAAAFSNIVVSGVTKNGFTVTWNSAVARSSVVNYGVTTGYGAQSTNATLTTSHSRTITGVNPSTVYNFNVGGADGSAASAFSANQTVRTLAEITNIVVDQITSNGARFTWTSSEPMTNTISCGLTTSYDITRSHLSQFITSHEISLSPATGQTLTTNTLYHCQASGVTEATSATVLSSDFTFTTNDLFLTVNSIVVSPQCNGDTIITWSTNNPADSTINYGLRPILGTINYDATLVTSHSRTLSNLLRNKYYYFTLKSENSTGKAESAKIRFFSKPLSCQGSDDFNSMNDDWWTPMLKEAA